MPIAACFPNFSGRKKKLQYGQRFVIPPSYFKSEKFTSEKITSAGSIVPKSHVKVETDTETSGEIKTDPDSYKEGKNMLGEPSEALSNENTKKQPTTDNRQPTTDNRKLTTDNLKK